MRGLAEEVYSSLKAMFQGQENESTPSKEGVRRKMMVARGGIGGKAPSRRTAGKRATSSKPVRLCAPAYISVAFTPEILFL